MSSSTTTKSKETLLQQQQVAAIMVVTPLKDSKDDDDDDVAKEISFKTTESLVVSKPLFSLQPVSNDGDCAVKEKMMTPQKKKNAKTSPDDEGSRMMVTPAKKLPPNNNEATACDCEFMYKTPTKEQAITTTNYNNNNNTKALDKMVTMYCAIVLHNLAPSVALEIHLLLRLLNIIDSTTGHGLLPVEASPAGSRNNNNGYVALQPQYWVYRG